MNRLSAPQVAQLQSLLQDRKHALLDDLQRDAKALRDDSARNRDAAADAGELSDADHAAAVSAGEMARDAGELQAVELALERLAHGKLGECSDCGTNIPFQRLLASPTAQRCVDCQEKFERTHPGRTPHSL